MGNDSNYDQWAGRDSLFRSKLTNVRNKPTQQMAPPAQVARAVTHEHYLEQVTGERAALGMPAQKQSLDELEKLALVDEATELFNWRWFQKQLAYEMKRGERYKRYLSIALVTID